MTRNPIAEELRRDVVNAIRYTAEQTGRSAQAAMGPSEIGDPCDRKLAYRYAGQPVINWGDPLAAFLGTGGHAQLESALTTWEGQEAEAARIGGDLLAPYRDNPRYLLETRVHPAPGLSGTCDLYDLYGDVVGDHKWVGAYSLNKYRKRGPSTTYRKQAHLYGLGWENAGYDPKHVAIIFYPRETNAQYNVRCSLDYVFVWSEPYDRTIAEEALERADRIRTDVAELGDAIDDMWEIFPTTTGACQLCPFYNPLAADLRDGCPGV